MVFDFSNPRLTTGDFYVGHDLAIHPQVDFRLINSTAVMIWG